MREYVLTMAGTLFLAWLISNTYIEHPRSLLTKSKDHFCYFLIFLILSLFFGLRIKYNDTFVYVNNYAVSPAFPEFWDVFSNKLGDNPGFAIVNAWLKTNNVSSYGFTLFYTTVFVGCAVYFLKKYSHGFLFSLFLFFATNSYSLSAAAIKQATAIALALLAVDAAFAHKWIKYAFFLLIASTFHPYVLLYGLLPFLFFKPWTKPTYLLLLITIVVGFTLESLLGTIVDIASMIGDTYTEEEFIGDGINVFRVLVANVPLFLSFLYRKELFAHSTREENAIINLSMINGAVMFVGLFGNPIYFSRLATYFTFFQCCVLPLLLSKLSQRERRFYTTAAILGYSLFFIYANMIVGSFDTEFSRITLLRYLREFVFK